MSELVVRRAEVADAEAVGRLLMTSTASSRSPRPARTLSLSASDSSWPAARPRSLLGGSGPNGVAVLRFRAAIFEEALECYLAELYVVPDHRGQGLGRALMEAAMEVARGAGATHMDLGTSEGDVAARGLYESLGFSNREGRPDGPINYFYEREL